MIMIIFIAIIVELFHNFIKRFCSSYKLVLERSNEKATRNNFKIE